MRRRAYGLAVAAALLLRAATSSAHAVGVSRGEYRADGREVHADLVFARSELDTTRTTATVDDWLRRSLVIAIPTGPCDGEVASVTPTEQDGLAIAAVYRCPAPIESFAVRFDLWRDLSLGHRHLLNATTPTGSVRAVLYEAEPDVTVRVADAGVGSAGDIAAGMLRLGIAHILTGYDHLLFLLAVVLMGGALRSLLGVVTAFTLAHSVTLAVAASGLWTPRPTLVEPAIALSIAYVGIENCFVADLRRRWRLTFLFGLVHGFGFAGALREVAVAPTQLPVVLASFNVGVEAGQLAVLALILPAVTVLGRQAWFRRGGLQLASGAITTVGLCWFVVRVVGG